MYTYVCIFICIYIHTYIDTSIYIRLLDKANSYLLYINRNPDVLLRPPLFLLECKIRINSLEYVELP